MAAILLIATSALAWLVVAQPWIAAAPETRPGWSIIRPPHDVNALVVFDGKVVAGGRDGLAAFDPETAQPADLPPGAPGMTYVKALLVAGDGTLWIGHRTGLARLDGSGWHETAIDAATPPGPVASLLQMSDGTILAGGEAGLVAVSSETLLPVPLPASHESGGVSSLFEDAYGRLWVGFSSPTQGGLAVRDSGIWREITAADGLLHPAVNAIGADSAGRLLVAAGYSGRGAGCTLEDIKDLTSWRCLRAEDGLASDMVRLIAEDSHGQVWYGSEFKGLAVFKDGAMHRFGPADGLAGTELKAFLEDASGNLWLGCDKGLTRIAANAVTAGE